MSDLSIFTDSGKTLIASGLKSVLSGRKAAGPCAAAIIAAENPAAAMTAFFQGCRGEYLAAKRDGAKVKSTDLGKAWKLVRDAMSYHFGNAGFRATWPNWASGEGSATLMTKKEAAEAAKTAAIARNDADAAALAQYENDRSAAETAALREKGPTDLATDLAAVIRAWSDSTADHMAVFSSLASALGFADKVPAAKLAEAAEAAA